MEERHTRIEAATKQHDLERRRERRKPPTKQGRSYHR